jgi:hypothetical protein
VRKLSALLCAVLILMVAGLSACGATAATSTKAAGDVTVRITGYWERVDQAKTFPPERQAEIDAHTQQFPAGNDPNYEQWSAQLNKKYPVVYEKAPNLYYYGYITVTANGVPTSTEVMGVTPKDWVFKGAANDAISCVIHNTDAPEGDLPEYLQVDIIKDGKVVATGNAGLGFTGVTVSAP